MNGLEQAAVATYPELARLIELRQGGGWVFQPLLLNGEVELLAGWRPWPEGGWVDTIAVRNRGDAKAYRCTHDGYQVWDREGSLAEVLEGLIDLPAPDRPDAPTLVIGTGPVLWIPRGLR